MTALGEAFADTFCKVGHELSDGQAHNVGVAVELTKHARTLPKGHPDREKFVLESARLMTGGQNPALTALTEPYDIPHDRIRAGRQVELDNEARFQRGLREGCFY